MSQENFIGYEDGIPDLGILDEYLHEHGILSNEFILPDLTVADISESASSSLQPAIFSTTELPSTSRSPIATSSSSNTETIVETGFWFDETNLPAIHPNEKQIQTSESVSTSEETDTDDSPGKPKKKKYKRAKQIIRQISEIRGGVKGRIAIPIPSEQTTTVAVGETVIQGPKALVDVIRWATIVKSKKQLHHGPLIQELFDELVGLLQNLSSEEEIYKSLFSRRKWRYLSDNVCRKGTIWTKPRRFCCDYCHGKKYASDKTWRKTTSHYIKPARELGDKICEVCLRNVHQFEHAIKCTNCIITFWMQRPTVEYCGEVYTAEYYRADSATSFID